MVFCLSFYTGKCAFSLFTSFGFAEHIFLDNLDNLKNIDAREPRSVCGPVSALVACMHAPYMGVHAEVQGHAISSAVVIW